MKSYFGNPHVLWSHQAEMFKKEFENKSVWGSHGSQTFFMAIASILEFIRKGKKLSNDYLQLKANINSTFTTNTIRRHLPFKLQDQLNDYIGELGISEEEKLKKIKGFLEGKKISAQQQCQVTGGQEQEQMRFTGKTNYSQERDHD